MEPISAQHPGLYRGSEKAAGLDVYKPLSTQEEDSSSCRNTLTSGGEAEGELGVRSGVCGNI